jgi:hypothetical protein
MRDRPHWYNERGEPIAAAEAVRLLSDVERRIVGRDRFIIRGDTGRTARSRRPTTRHAGASDVGVDTLVGVPMGQYHCSYCGAMVIAGIPHLDYRE